MPVFSKPFSLIEQKKVLLEALYEELREHDSRLRQELEKIIIKEQKKRILNASRTKVRGKQQKKKVDDWEKSKWGVLLNDPKTWDPDSYQGKNFRNKFRVPMPVFQYLLYLCKQNNIFEEKKPDKKQKIPTEYKLLCCLYILGQGCQN